jgi:phosphatidylethanolamine/phosphatidyl-N-methylethanolamine N-methyltransferase
MALPRSALFLTQWVRHWRETGAVLPSGPRLARAMVDQVGRLDPGQVIIELGPGTGPFTRELNRRYHDHRVVAVEFNPEFVKRLRAEIPRVTVVEGCASRLAEHLRGVGIEPHQVGVVLSGLPLLSLPGDLPQRIIAAVTGILQPGRRYLQFTYAPGRWSRFEHPGLTARSRRRVWLNMPPATVLEFQRAA